MLDFENLELPKDATLTEKAIGLAQEAIALQEQIAEYEEDLKSLKDRAKRICDVELPDIMRQDARDHLILPDGQKVTLKDVVNATMPKADDERKAFFAWLSDHEATDIIKSQIAIAFGKSQHNEAMDLAQRLAAEGLPVNVSESIHPQTLNAFVRERLQNGEELPSREILPVYEAKVAKIAGAK